MATLENKSTGEYLILHACHVFGRGGSGVNTLLNGMDISHVHASIRWEGTHWKIFDHSRNGTWIDTARISHESLTLTLNCVIRFGASEQSVWKVDDLSSPQTILVPLQANEATILLTRLHVLPDTKNPEISIYYADHDQWVCETQNRVKPLKDGEIIQSGRKSWQFFSAKAVDSTLGIGEYKHITINDIIFNFIVSLDEEHVVISVVHNSKTFDLHERVHHYLLLILARARLEDARSGVDQDNQGWIEIETLSKMLQLDLTYLNIQIFRARKQVAEALPNVIHLLQVVERRPGGIRFGLPYFKIMRGANVEGELMRK